MVGEIIKDQNTRCFTLDLLPPFDSLETRKALQEIPDVYVEKNGQGQRGKQVGNIVTAVQGGFYLHVAAIPVLGPQESEVLLDRDVTCRPVRVATRGVSDYRAPGKLHFGRDDGIILIGYQKAVGRDQMDELSKALPHMIEVSVDVGMVKFNAGEDRDPR